MTFWTERVNILGRSVGTAELVASLIEEAVAASPARFADPELHIQMFMSGADAGPCTARAAADYWAGRPTISTDPELVLSVVTLRRIVAHVDVNTRTGRKCQLPTGDSAQVTTGGNRRGWVATSSDRNETVLAFQLISYALLIIGAMAQLSPLAVPPRLDSLYVA